MLIETAIGDGDAASDDDDGVMARCNPVAVGNGYVLLVMNMLLLVRCDFACMDRRNPLEEFLCCLRPRSLMALPLLVMTIMVAARCNPVAIGNGDVLLVMIC